MNEAASIFLRADIQTQDGHNLAGWMNDNQITKYLNEYGNISEEINSLLERASTGMLTYYFNQCGRFFMICTQCGTSIGFVKLTHPVNKKCEIVYAIGERPLWGHGYGKHAVELALGKAFFEMRVEHVTARIMKANLRSIRAVTHCGMRLIEERHDMLIYGISVDEYMASLKKSDSKH